MCPLLWQENRTALQGKAARPVCNCPGVVARNREHGENPCLEGIHRDMPGTQSLFMTGDSPLSKMQLDVVLLSALYIRGRCLKHLPKECSGSCSRIILSWAGISIKTLQLLSQEERPLKAGGAHLPDSSLALGQLAQGDLLCWFLLLQLFVPFTLNISSRKKKCTDSC